MLSAMSADVKKINDPGSHVSNSIIVELNSLIYTQVVPTKAAELENKISVYNWPLRPNEAEWDEERDEALKNEKFNLWENKIRDNIEDKQIILADFFDFLRDEIIGNLALEALNGLFFGKLEGIQDTVYDLNEFYLENYEA
uniref:Uncharacterized protein n=1 Tax=Meloidogyne hapla TaxID=6305 RepID=A0A1I8AXQ4_MELHA